jgi:putative acetyltransferase
MPTIIVPESPDTADARALIAELDAYLIPLYPIEDHYGYSIEKLLEEEVAFFVIRQDGMAVGCGGIKLFGTAYGEIKRMYVRPAFRPVSRTALRVTHVGAHGRDHHARSTASSW